MSYYYEVFLSVIICQHNRKFSKYGCYRQLWLFQKACMIKLLISISIMFIKKWWFFHITHRIVFHRPIVHNILKLIKDDICINKNRKSKLWDIGVELLFFPHSWLSMVQDDLMCNAYSQSMWSSAKFPVVFLLKFGWWEVNCFRKVNTQGFTQSIVSWPAFRNNFVVYPLHFFLQRR